MDLASQYRERPMSLHGIDIGSALFESHPDLNLHEHDILQPIPESWGWSNTFDIVHQRFLVWGIKKLDWAVVVRNLCQAVKPGGYIVFVECKWIFPENWEKQREQHKLALTQIWSTETFGMDIHAYAQLEPLLQNVGFVDVKTHSYDWGYGAAAKKPEQKTSSAEMWVESFRHLGGKLSGKLDASRFPVREGGLQVLTAFHQGTEYQVLPKRRRSFTHSSIGWLWKSRSRDTFLN